MNISQAIAAAFFSTTLLVTGCANTARNSTGPQSNVSSYGVIESIDVIKPEAAGIGGSGIGVGTVIGGVIGGVLGNQVGGGRGNTVATVAGAVGGAVVGHEIEKGRQAKDSYRVRIHLDRGGYQTITQDNIDNMGVGSRVRIENDHLYRD